MMLEMLCLEARRVSPEEKEDGYIGKEKSPINNVLHL